MRLLLASLTLACAAATGAGAVESDPLPVPKGTPREHAIGLYNHGVLLLLQRQDAAAQQRFEAALEQDDSIAEAHNNLAFVLRRQGHHERALAHYGRALALKPALAEAYVYRGALFVLLGRLDEARADHARLHALNPKLAALLARVIAGESVRETSEGLSAQYD